IETGSGQTAAGNAANFESLWFGANPPAGLQVGSYSGSGVGLSSNGDAVNLFDAGGNLITGVQFGGSPRGPFATFDNSAGLGSSPSPLPSLTTLTSIGAVGAFVAAGDTSEIGSPGTLVNNKPVASTSPGSIDIDANATSARTVTLKGTDVETA